jgi:hypothetical protein
MRASDTHLAYTQRWVAGLPGPPTLRQEVGNSLTDIAQLSVQDRFSRDGLAEPERERMTDAWRKVLRAFPLLTWLRIRSRVARATDTTE